MTLFNRVYFAVTGAALVAGCHTYPHASTGWEFRVGRPGYVATAPQATVITQGHTQGLVGLDHTSGMAALPAGMGAEAMAQAQRGCYCRSVAMDAYHSGGAGHGQDGARMAMGAASAVNCTLEQLCQRMERIEQRLGAASAGPLASPLPPLRPGQ